MAVQPVPFAMSGEAWGGSDGNWSTFRIDVGTPPQSFHVLPSTSAPFTLLPDLEACDFEFDPSNCPELRGVFQSNTNPDGFDDSISSTWIFNDGFELAIAANLTTVVNDVFAGNDTLAMSTPSNKTVTLEDSFVALFATHDFTMGFMGLDPQNLQLAEETVSQPNMMQVLKDSGHIPSLSFAYTAGAAYRPGQPPAHLALGGFDNTLWVDKKRSSLEFSFNETFDRPFTVALQTILVENSFEGDVPLLPNQVFTMIDSTLPFIWLPRESCDRFEETFKLEFDNRTDLYLINDTTREQLLELNPTITFKLGNDFTSGQAVNIELPYKAFDLQIEFPWYRNQKNYFPIKRASRPDQLVIGRAFLQEAYLIADFERQNFTIAQAAFPEVGSSSDMIAIASMDSSTAPPPPQPIPTEPQSSRTNLPIPVIIGATVGGTSVLTLYFGIMFFRRRNARIRRLAAFRNPPPKDIEYRAAEADSIAKPAEADTGKTCGELRETGSSRPASAIPVRLVRGVFEIGSRSPKSPVRSMKDESLLPEPLRPQRARSKGLPRSPREPTSPKPVTSLGGEKQLGDSLAGRV